MEYITIKQAAEKWNISTRLIQRLCADGRIIGAIKNGRAWAIPVDAQKPSDPRRLTSQKADFSKKPSVPQSPNSSAAAFTPLPLINSAFRIGFAMDTIIAIPDPDTRSIALCEYYYFSGNPEKATLIAENYIHSENSALRLSACWLYGYANLALNRISRARDTLTRIYATLSELDESTPSEITALAVCIATGASVLLHLPIPENQPPLKGYIAQLPPGLKLFALYILAHSCYLDGDYGTSIGIIEAALTMQQEIYPIPTIYLHMCATMDYMSLKNTELAREHLLAAWELARPDDLIEPFGEHHGLLGGMLEAVIKKDWPDDFKRMIAITYSFSSGWRKVHNPVTGQDVADNLTTTEFAVAMLAARDWSNKEIGAHLGISTNTVKHHISIALQKLGINHRDELVQHMLR